jgi:hypothetical protein
MNYETYYIPANFTDAGKILGLFAVRNVIEAILLGMPVLFLCFSLLPFALTARIIVTLVIFVPIAGFALIGINDDSLSRYMKAWVRWRKNRRVLTYRGEVYKNGFERTYIRRRCQRA